MSTIRSSSTGTVEERLRRLEQALSFEEELHCAQVVDPAAVTSITPQSVQRWSIPLVDLRQLMPEDRWAIYAAGFATCTGTFTLGIGYTNNAAAVLTLGTQTFGAIGWTKLHLGPYAARGPLAPGVPLEEVATYGLIVSVADAAKPLSLTGWTYWMRMSPRST